MCMASPTTPFEQIKNFYTTKPSALHTTVRKVMSTLKSVVTVVLMASFSYFCYKCWLKLSSK